MATMNTEKTYMSVKEKLGYIQKNESEATLFPTLMQLFVHMGYKNVQITHGTNEYGRDLVFSTNDTQLGGEEWFSVVVKNKNADMWDFRKDGEIGRQIMMSFTHPWLRENGSKVYTNKVLVVVNGSISHQAKEAMSDYEPYLMNNIIFWNYQLLEQKIEQFIKELFLNGETGTREEYDINVYKKKIIEDLSNLGNAKQLFGSSSSIAEVNDIFVNVRTANRKYEAEKKKYSDVHYRSMTEEIDDAISILNSNKHTIITGIPTAGKTMLLKRIGLHALQRNNQTSVFWFDIKDINPATIDFYHTIDSIFASLTNGAQYQRSKFTKEVLLFDALDEVNSDDKKREFIEKIKEYAEQNERVQVIISGRELEIFDDKTLFADFEKIELLPFDVGQALSLVNKIIPGNKTKNNKFVSAIRKQQLSSSLTRTPMALTLMAIMYGDDKIDLEELPANITELYSKFSDYYLDKWDASKGISSQYKYEQVKNIMGFIAQYMHEKYITEIGAQELEELLVEVRKTHHFDELDDVQKYVRQLKERSTLLCYDAHRDAFYFAGTAFQEFFASVYYDDSNESDLLGYAFNDWWQNVIVFYNGKSPKRTVFIDKLVRHQIPANGKAVFNYMHLVSHCIQAAHLMPNVAVQRGIRNIIDTFEHFYQIVWTTSSNGQSFAYSWTTLDAILQFRKLFETLFASRHITNEDFEAVANDIMLNAPENYSDVTLYCMGYHLMNHGKMEIMQMFLERPHNTRWDRIVSVDVKMKKLQHELSPNVYNRIKRKQKSNKDYIDQQFKESAILHLFDGTQLKELKA